MKMSKIDTLKNGGIIVCNSEWLDVNDHLLSELEGVEIVSIPNPNRVGVKDEFIVGDINNPTIHAYRVKNGIV